MKNIFSLFVRGMALCVAMASCTVIEKGYVTPPLAICDYSAQEMFFESDHHIYEIISGGGYDVGLGSLKGDFFYAEVENLPRNKARVHVILEENDTGKTRYLSLGFFCSPFVDLNGIYIVQYFKAPEEDTVID